MKTGSCRHPREGIVTSHPGGPYTSPHAACSVCSGEQCIRKAQAWVYERTGILGIYVPDGATPGGRASFLERSGNLKGADLHLFHVQDVDRPLYVLARNYEEALRVWRDVIAIENDITDDAESEQPQGIHYLAGPDEIAAPHPI